MQRHNQSDFTHKELKILLMFNGFYCLFFLLYFIKPKLTNDLLDIHYSLTASKNEIENWYPNYSNYIYSTIITIRIVFALILIRASFWLKKNKANIQQRLRKVTLQQSYSAFAWKQGKITILSLLFYLILYFISKYYLSVSYHRPLQIIIARGFLSMLIVQLLIILYYHIGSVYQFFRKFLLKPSMPYNIAILRILFFSFLLKFIYQTKLHTALSVVSLTNKKTLPFVGWLIDIIPVNAEIYKIMAHIGIVSCLFIIMGFKTRWFLIINAVTIFYVMATPNFFGKLWHEQIFIWISWFFAFSRCYDVLSIDNKLRKQPIVKSPNYTYPIRFVWFSFGIIYFWAGFYKLWDAGFDWALSKSMINQVQLEWVQAYDVIPKIRIDLYPILLYIGGATVIFFELSFPILLLKQKLRYFAVAGGLIMHNLIGYFMYISFFLGLQVIYVFFIDFSKLFKEKVAVPNSQRVSKPALYLGLFVITANFIFGMLSIDSYPFSAYPKYAMLIDDNLKIIHFEVRDSKHKIDVHQIGKSNNFRWEDFGWLEYNLIQDYENGKDISKELKDYWEKWTKGNTELIKYKDVSVSIIERPIAPEGKYKIKTLYDLGKINVE